MSAKITIRWQALLSAWRQLSVIWVTPHRHTSIPPIPIYYPLRLLMPDLVNSAELAFAKEYGLAYRLCAVTTNLPLDPDLPVNLGIEDFCYKCTKCADACPPGLSPERV